MSSPENEVTKEFFPDERVDRIMEIINPQIEDWQIKEESFADLYNANLLKDHARTVRNYEAQWRESDTPEDVENKKKATILEHIICTYAELDDWFGDFLTIDGEKREDEITATNFFPSAKFDDYVNHVDILVQPSSDLSPKGVEGMSLDSTFSHSYKAINDKAHDYKQLLKNGKLGRVQYGEIEGFRGVIDFVPRFTLSISAETLMDTAEMIYLRGKQVPQEEQKRQRDRMKQLILFQLFIQSYVMAEIATSLQKKYRDDITERGIEMKNNLALSIKKESAAFGFFSDALTKQASESGCNVVQYLNRAPKNDKGAKQVVAHYLYLFHKHCPDKLRVDLAPVDGQNSESLIKALSRWSRVDKYMEKIRRNYSETDGGRTWSF